MEEDTGGNIKVSGKMVEALLKNAALLQRVLLSSQKRISRHFFEPIGQEEEFPEFGEEEEFIDEKQERLEKNLNDRAFEGLVIITLFSFFCILLMTIYVGIAWLNFNMIFGYPAIAVPPSPGPFVSQRYTFMYFMVVLLGVNFLPPIALMIAGNIPDKISGIFFHQIMTILAFVINIISGLFLVILYWWFCNGAGATMSVLANDVSWCCVHFAANPIICPIAMTGCIAGSPTTRAELMLPLEYMLSMIAALIFFILTWGHLQINGSFGTWGLWRNAL